MSLSTECAAALLSLRYPINATHVNFSPGEPCGGDSGAETGRSLGRGDRPVGFEAKKGMETKNTYY